MTFEDFSLPATPFMLHGTTAVQLPAGNQFKLIVTDGPLLVTRVLYSNPYYHFYCVLPEGKTGRVVWTATEAKRLILDRQFIIEPCST